MKKYILNFFGCLKCTNRFSGHFFCNWMAYIFCHLKNAQLLKANQRVTHFMEEGQRRPNWELFLSPSKMLNWKAKKRRLPLDKTECELWFFWQQKSFFHSFFFVFSLWGQTFRGVGIFSSNLKVCRTDGAHIHEQHNSNLNNMSNKMLYWGDFIWSLSNDYRNIINPILIILSSMSNN